LADGLDVGESNAAEVSIEKVYKSTNKNGTVCFSDSNTSGSITQIREFENIKLSDSEKQSLEKARLISQGEEIKNKVRWAKRQYELKMMTAGEYIDILRNATNEFEYKVLPGLDGIKTQEILDFLAKSKIK